MEVGAGRLDDDRDGDVWLTFILSTTKDLDPVIKILRREGHRRVGIKLLRMTTKRLLRMTKRDGFVKMYECQK